MGFDSPSPLKDTQHVSRNCDGDGDSNSMAFDSSFPKQREVVVQAHRQLLLEYYFLLKIRFCQQQQQ